MSSFVVGADEGARENLRIGSDALCRQLGLSAQPGPRTWTGTLERLTEQRKISVLENSANNVTWTMEEGSCHPARIGIGPIWIGMSRAGRGGCEYCFRRDPLRFQPALVRFHPRPYGFSRLKP